MSERKAKEKRKQNTVKLTEIESLTLENKKLKVTNLQKEGDLMIAKYKEEIQKASEDHRNYFVGLCENHNKKAENILKVDTEKKELIFKE